MPPNPDPSPSRKPRARWKRNRVVQITERWWAIPPDGGSIRLKYGGYFYYPAATTGYKNEQGKPPKGPFRDFLGAVAAAQKYFDFELQVIDAPH